MKLVMYKTVKTHNQQDFTATSQSSKASAMLVLVMYFE